MLNDISGRKVVNLRMSGAQLRVVPEEDDANDDADVDDLDMVASQSAPSVEPKGDPIVLQELPEKTPNRRVFVSHGSDKTIVDQLKDMLTFGKYEPVIAVEHETTSKPVPDKVMDEMRTCTAG